MKRFLFFIASVMLLSSLFSFAFVGTASAHTVAASHSVQTSKQAASSPNISPALCSDSGVLEIWSYNFDYEDCFTQPGVYNFLADKVNYVYAGNWSGILEFSNGSSLKFCDYGVYYVSGTLTKIYISPTRLAGC